MDFTNLNEKAREAELDQREVMSLLRFYNFRRERNGEPRLDTDYNYSRIFDWLEEAYPDLSFRRVDHRIFAAVRPRGKGSLVEKIGFVSGHIPHLAITGVYGFDGVCVVFRADGVGVIKEGSWYEFFEHDLDQAYLEVRQGRPVNPLSPSRRGIIVAGASIHLDLSCLKLSSGARAMEKSMLKIVDGNLLDSDFQHIAHQCNCYSRRGAGLASAIFKAFPWADVYSNRSERGNDASLFGSITVHGDPKRNQRYVINIYGQLKPGKPSQGRDSAASRLEAFGKALDQIAELPELKSIGFPYGIGCGLAGGDWEKYESLLKDFAERVGERGVSVILYRLDR